jgi:hypothetical protein
MNLNPILVFAVAAVLAAVLVFWFAKRRQLQQQAPRDDEKSPAVDAWLASALSDELCRGIESLAAERERVKRALGGDADSSIVSTIEESVRGVELEYLRYAHEEHADVVAHVRYEGGATGEVRGRVAVADLPVAVKRDLDAKATQRVFRPYVFPWSAARIA